jgi:hypothetical protein
MSGERPEGVPGMRGQRFVGCAECMPELPEGMPEMRYGERPEHPEFDREAMEAERAERAALLEEFVDSLSAEQLEMYEALLFFQNRR